MKVAAVQFAPAFRDVDANLRTAESMVQEAAGQGAQLIVLPELMTAGYSFQSVEEALPFAEMIHHDSVSMALMAGLVDKFNATIVWGLVEKDHGTGDLYNAQVLMTPGGHHWTCRKINRWGNDFIWAQAGDQSPPVAQFLDKKLGMLICHDAKNKASGWTDFYEPGDADIVCFSANWGDGGFPAERWVQFATKNNAWFVVGNRYGQERNNNFGEGGVCVISPEGKVYCDGLKWSEPCIVYAETT